MWIELDKDSKIPFYIQIKEQIKKMIQEGLLTEGEQLPTERELSETLNISRNTVSTAYEELKRERIIDSSPGKGTFVAASDKSLNIKIPQDKMRKYGEMFEKVIDEALQEDLSLDDISGIFKEKLKEKKKLLKKTKIAFVECNYEQLSYFSHRLELGVGVNIHSFLLDDIYKDIPGFLRQLKDIDFIVTTFFHLPEVEKIVQGKKPVIAISLDPQIETMVRIARIPEGSKVSLVCISDRFAERVKKSLKNVGITNIELKHTTTRDIKKLQKFLKGTDAIIVSPGRKRDVETLIKDKELPIIEFVYVPDKGSIHNLRMKIVKAQKEKEKNGNQG